MESTAVRWVGHFLPLGRTVRKTPKSFSVSRWLKSRASTFFGRGLADVAKDNDTAVEGNEAEGCLQSPASGSEGDEGLCSWTCSDFAPAGKGGIARCVGAPRGRLSTSPYA